MTYFQPDDPPRAGFAFHGGRLDQAIRAFPHAPRPWLDLSTGINPVAWPIDRAPPVDPRLLPSDAGMAGLLGAAASFFGLKQVAIAAVPGSEIGLRCLAALALPRPWHLVTPGYRSHADALPGATAVPIDALDAAAAHGGTILLANPNNPDGRGLPRERLLAIGRAMAARGGMLVIDEAFADADAQGSVAPLLTPEDRIVILRSFGKFFGLAGVRLGFVAGAADMVAHIATRLGSWPVSAQAIGYGTAAYADTDWIATTRARLVDAAAALDRLLAAHGLGVRGACPLFRLIEDARASALFDTLAQAGILTRPFDYAADWLRLGLPADDAAFARLAGALRRF